MTVYFVKFLRPIIEFVELMVLTLVGVITPPFRWKDFIRQVDFVGVQSMPIVVFSVCFSASMTILEASYHMKLAISNDSLVPGFASMLIIRELGAVIACLLVTSRVGAGLAAEIGTMKITEQIDALKLLGIDPVRFLVVPRFLACIVGCVLLTVFANVICLLAAMVVSHYKLGFTSGNFLMAMRTFVDFKDLFLSMVKGGAFGAVIPLVSCFFGFRCSAGAEGVGLTTTNSVVVSSVAIIVLDFILSWIFSYLY